MPATTRTAIMRRAASITHSHPEISSSEHYIWNRDLVDRLGDDTFYTHVPPSFNDESAKLLSTGWRWNPTANLTNELRGGFNRSPVPFNVSTPRPAFYLVSNTVLLSRLRGLSSAPGGVTKQYRPHGQRAQRNIYANRRHRAHCQPPDGYAKLCRPIHFEVARHHSSAKHGSLNKTGLRSRF
jgi:hypothetical protein